MGAVVDEYERCGTEALTDIWHQAPEMVADWMIAADREKAGEVWRALDEQLGLCDERRNQEWYLRVENQAQRGEAETRYTLPMIDKTKGWDTWHSKLAWLDGLSFEDRMREAPALLGNFDDWLDQVLGVVPARKKNRIRPLPT